MSRVCIISSVHSALDNRVFYREARSLRNAGYDVTLIAIHPTNEIKDDIQIIGLPQILRWQRPRLWISLIHQARSTKADIYHFHDPELLLVTPWLRLLTGKPTIYDVHEVYTDFIKVKDYMPVLIRYPIAWLFKWIEPLLARLQSGLIFSDDAIAKTFESINCSKVTLFNFPGMFFVEEAIKVTQNHDRNTPIVLHLGGHERNRGTRLMIAAFHQVLQIMPQARLLMVGHFMPPDLQDEVQEDIIQRGIQSAVTITGRVPFNTIGEYLLQASVGWMPWQPYPKNDKNIPTKLFEYMAYAVPIVSSDLSSTRPFIIDGENGYLVEAQESGAHARAILKILQNPELGSRMGQRGQELVRKHYNWNEEEKKLIALYANILKPHSFS